MLTLDFDDPRATDNRLVGGKGHGLAVMVQAGIPVSPGFTITTQAWRHYLAVTGLRDRLDATLAALDRTSIDALEEAAHTIESWFDYTPMPHMLLPALSEAYQHLCKALGVVDVSVAVRSSATAEDSAGTSFAGEYETFVGMRGLAQVDLHVRRCWASAFSARALSYPKTRLNYAEHVFRNATEQRPALLARSEDMPPHEVSWAQLESAFARSPWKSPGPSAGFQPMRYRSLTTTVCPIRSSSRTATFLSAPLNDAGSGCAKTIRMFMCPLCRRGTPAARRLQVLALRFSAYRGVIAPPSRADRRSGNSATCRHGRDSSPVQETAASARRSL